LCILRLFIFRNLGQRTSNFHVKFLDEIGALEHFGGGELASLRDFIHLIISQSNYHVLWLKICVDNLTLTVHIVEADQTLSRQFSYQRNWNALVIVTLNQLKKVHTKNLEDHNEVLTVRSMVNEGV